METRKDGPARRIAVSGDRPQGARSAADAPNGLPGVWLREAPTPRPALDRFPSWLPVSDTAIRALYTRPLLPAVDPRN
jgi:hypothetical protein